jgi:hypothetical protein
MKTSSKLVKETNGGALRYSRVAVQTLLPLLSLQTNNVMAQMSHCVRTDLGAILMVEPVKGTLNGGCVF